MIKKNFDVDYTLYLVTDREVLKNITLEQAVEEAILGGVTLVQLREKEASTGEFYDIAVKVKKITDKYNIPLLINDRLDIALAVDAAGIHIGQSDLPADVARKILGEDKIIGVSAGNLKEALKAQEDKADYIGVGSIFSTGTKKDAKYTSIDELKRIKETVEIPVVAIGGINEDNLHLLEDTKIDGISIISAILAKDDVKKASEILKEKFCR